MDKQLDLLQGTFDMPHPEGHLLGSLARLRNSVADPTNFEAATGNSAGTLISGALSPRAPRLD